MCLLARNQTRRTRAFLCIGLFCLALSLTLQNFHLIGSGPLDFVRGMLIGIAITMNFAAAFTGARLRRNHHA